MQPQLFRSLLLLSFGLISSGATAAYAVEQPSPDFLAQAVTDDERADLERLQQEANVAFTQATTLFSILLGALVLLIAVGVAMLWFLRRSVVQEVAAVVRTQLNEMTDLEHRIRAATRELNSVLKDAEEVADDIEQGAESFQDELAQKRRALTQALEEI
ncbi:MAG: hypothetical protein AAGH78_04400, partial [Cyanobacteria bacterium P01_H01_bin.58]